MTNLQAHREVLEKLALDKVSNAKFKSWESLIFTISLMEKITREPTKEIHNPTLHRVICEIVDDCVEADEINKAIVSYLTGDNRS